MSNLEIIDKLCEVTTLQNDIIRKQVTIIKQHEIVDAFEHDREYANDLLDIIEYNLRHA